MISHTCGIIYHFHLRRFHSPRLLHGMYVHILNAKTAVATTFNG